MSVGHGHKAPLVTAAYTQLALQGRAAAHRRDSLAYKANAWSAAWHSVLAVTDAR